MPDTDMQPRPSSARDLLFFLTPQLWTTWPFLPVVRRRPGQERECGLLYDAVKHAGRMGFSATVFLCNIFLLPETIEEFLTLPHETYDTPEEVYQAGWRVD
jgi:hypothetical protein